MDQRLIVAAHQIPRCSGQSRWRAITAVLFVPLLLGSACCVWGQSEVKIWSRLVGASNYDYCEGAAVDPFGNVFIGGPTQSSLGGQSAGVFDVYVGKYDSSGNQLWLAQHGSSDIEYGFDDLNGGISSDIFGNVYVVGRTKGALDGNSNIGGYDFFVMKFDGSGVWKWTRQDGTGQDDAARGVATDASGNIYVTGYVRGDLHGVTRVGGADVFINKYDQAGNRLWTVLFGSDMTDESFGITCDTAGNVIVTGWCDGSIDGIPNLGNGDNFLAKYDTNGQKLWLKQWGTVNKDTGYSVTTDAAQNIYLSGYTTGPLYASPSGNRDVFLAKFDASGNSIWGTQFGSSGHDQGWGVTADPAGNVYIAGQAGGQLGDDPYSGGLDLFVAKYSTSGSRIWLHQLGTINDDLARGIAMDTNGAVFAAGWSFDNFDGGTNVGLADAVIVKYAPSNAPPARPTARPATGATISGFTANWFNSSWAAGYRLDLSTNSGFSPYLAGYQDLDVGNVLNQSLTGLAHGATFYYRVRAYNTNGTSQNSDTITASTVSSGCSAAILLNQSFEGSSSAGIGTNWVGYSRSGSPPVTNTWSIQTAGPPAGGGSQYQQIANTSSTGGGGVRQNIGGCAIGATYVVSGWMRGNSGSANCRVKVSPTASSNFATAIDLTPPQSVNTSAWVAFSGTVVSTGTNMTLWLDGSTSGTGQNKASCFDAVTVTCLGPVTPLYFSSVSALPPNQVSLVLTGAAGAGVSIQRSSNLFNWQPWTNLLNGSGTLQLFDTPPAGVVPRFYRATSP